MSQSKFFIGGLIGFALGVLAYSEQTNLQNHQLKSKAENTDISLVQSPIQIVNYPHFKILYSKSLKIPLAVQQTITKENMNGNADRSNVFFEEPQIQKIFRAKQEHFKKTQAYKKLNLSRGHMAAAGNYNFSRKAKDDTFTYANVIPQDSDNNEDTWLTFETLQRQLLSKCQSVNIISGPIFRPYVSESERNSQHPILTMQYNILDKNGPAVPSHLYKIIRCNQKNGQSHASAFVFHNKYSYDNNKKLKSFEVPLQQLQKQTGLLFQFDQNSLTQFDKESFEMTKQQYNKKVLYPRIIKAKKYDQVQQQIRKLKGHKIKQQDQISLKIQQLVESKLQQHYNSSCQRVIQHLDLNSNLRRYKFLNDKISNKLDESVNTHIPKCEQKQQLQKIKQKLFYGQKYKPQYKRKISDIQQRLSKQ